MSSDNVVMCAVKLFIIINIPPLCSDIGIALSLVGHYEVFNIAILKLPALVLLFLLIYC